MSEPKLTQPMEQYKREHWCAKLRIPDSGNPELDAMIRRAQRRDLAAMAMQGFAANPSCSANGEHNATEAANWADALLAALLATLSTPPEGGER